MKPYYTNIRHKKITYAHTENNSKSTVQTEKSLKKVHLKIIELIASFLQRKHEKLFKEKNYTEKKLKNDLCFLITEKEMKHFNYEESIKAVEKSILDKLNIKETSVNSNITDLHKDIDRKFLIINKSTQSPSAEKEKLSKISSSAEDPEKFNNPLIQKLHKKENDEWAIKVKNDHQTFLQNEKDKFYKESQLKQSTKEFYELQVLEKEFKKKLEREELDKFLKIRDENLKKIEITDKKNLIRAKEKIKSQRDIKTKMLYDFYEIKNSQKLKDEMEQKNYLDYLNLKKKEEEEKILQKKKIVKDLYKNVYQQIENKIEKNKIEKTKEKLENLKKLEEYSKILKQRDDERFKTIYDSLTKFEKKCRREESPEFVFVDREKMKNKLAEKRYEEQLMEKEIR